MIRKVAVVQALREAFPDKFQGLYAQEEFPDVSDVKLDVEKLWQKRYRQMQTLSSFLTQHLRKYRRPQRRTLPAQRHRIALSRRKRDYDFVKVGIVLWVAFLLVVFCKFIY